MGQPNEQLLEPVQPQDPGRDHQVSQHRRIVMPAFLKSRSSRKVTAEDTGDEESLSSPRPGSSTMPNKKFLSPLIFSRSPKPSKSRRKLMISASSIAAAAVSYPERKEECSPSLCSSETSLCSDGWSPVREQNKKSHRDRRTLLIKQSMVRNLALTLSMSASSHAESTTEDIHDCSIDQKRVRFTETSSRTAIDDLLEEAPPPMN